MSKKIRREAIYIAPDISGRLDDNSTPIVYDERNRLYLNPADVMDKIKIYERQVVDWFLNPASKLIKYRNKNNGFVVLMICISYLEGVEQYRMGQSSNSNSRVFFKSAMQRMYPNRFQDFDLNNFYDEARCGLFHDGMTRQRIIINNSFKESIEFDTFDIKISPSKFLADIKNDFNNFLNELRTNQLMRNDFDRMYSVT